jgi:cytochrome P450
MENRMHSKPAPSLADIPGPRGWPLIGNLPKLLPDPLPYVTSLQREHGNVFYANFAMNQRTVFLLGPDAAERVLVNHDKCISNRLGYAEQARTLGERGLLFLDGDDHRNLRRRANPAFNAAALRRYLRPMNSIIEGRVSRWGEEVSSGLADDIRRLSLDIAAAVILGSEVGEAGDRVISHFLHMLAASASVLPALPGTPKWRAARGREYMQRYFRDQLVERRGDCADDLFTAICNPTAGEPLSDDEIVHNMIGIFVAGYETTAITLMMMTHFLGHHPEWQHRLRAEYETVGCLGSLEYESLDALFDTECVLKETLRLNPPLPFLPRTAVSDFEFEGRTIRAGTSLIISPAFIHRMPSIYRDPADFDPARFAEPRSEDKVHPCAWMPFGKGPHTCMGMNMARLEVKAFFAQLLARFDIEGIPHSPLRMRHVPVQGPEGASLGVRLRARRAH